MPMGTKSLLYNNRYMYVHSLILAIRTKFNITSLENVLLTRTKFSDNHEIAKIRPSTIVTIRYF